MAHISLSGFTSLLLCISAASLRLAEQYIQAFSNIAKEVSKLSSRWMQILIQRKLQEVQSLFRSQKRSQAQRKLTLRSQRRRLQRRRLYVRLLPFRVLQVHPSKVYSLIGSGGKKVKSIIEESVVEAIDMQDDGIVKIMANNVASLERAKAIISGLTMVPAVGDIYRNCEIKSMAPYGAFVEIAPGREGLCHITELSAEWLAKPEDKKRLLDLHGWKTDLTGIDKAWS
ncbi:unnamed protein product [Eruca vesicaria subsp. sativa]|uniref:S1 motif domain-containing protein n=1 Tax=Eruca vesicaria subsp. sativa TaxID=29727 RepID=A0ABC8KW53_ERUVS|nr:unnamed protein product [Eruca vesicaria subsp. sativa]